MGIEAAIIAASLGGLGLQAYQASQKPPTPKTPGAPPAPIDKDPVAPKQKKYRAPAQIFADEDKKLAASGLLG